MLPGGATIFGEKGAWGDFSEVKFNLVFFFFASLLGVEGTSAGGIARVNGCEKEVSGGSRKQRSLNRTTNLYLIFLQVSSCLEPLSSFSRRFPDGSKEIKQIYSDRWPLAVGSREASNCLVLKFFFLFSLSLSFFPSFLLSFSS